MAYPDDPTQDPMAEVCKYCGAIDRPLLSPGTGPHACRADCQHCGKFWRWVSVLSPAERAIRRLKGQALAMSKKPPSQAQLDFLAQLGDREAPPSNMAEASERIEKLKGA